MKIKSMDLSFIFLDKYLETFQAKRETDFMVRAQAS